MDIRNAVVDGVRVFCIKDVATAIGTVTQSLRCSADESLTSHFSGSHGGDSTNRLLVGFPYREFKRLIEKRLKRYRIGNALAPAVLEWMSSQSDLEKPLEEIKVVLNFAEMSPEEIYESGRLDEFLGFVAKEKDKAERNEALRSINLAKIELQKLLEEKTNAI